MSLLDDIAPMLDTGAQSRLTRAQLVAAAERGNALANARAAALDAAARVVASGRTALGVLDLADTYLAWLLAPEDGGQPEVEGGNGPC